MNCSEEEFGVFRIYCCNAAPAFDVKKSIFDKMPDFVKLLILISLNFTIPFWRNNRIHSLSDGLLNNSIAITPLCQPIDVLQVFRLSIALLECNLLLCLV